MILDEAEHDKLYDSRFKFNEDGTVFDTISGKTFEAVHYDYLSSDGTSHGNILGRDIEITLELWLRTIEAGLQNFELSVEQAVALLDVAEEVKEEDKKLTPDEVILNRVTDCLFKGKNAAETITDVIKMLHSAGRIDPVINLTHIELDDLIDKEGNYWKASKE